VEDGFRLVIVIVDSGFGKGYIIAIVAEGLCISVREVISILPEQQSAAVGAGGIIPVVAALAQGGAVGSGVGILGKMRRTAGTVETFHLQTVLAQLPAFLGREELRGQGFSAVIAGDRRSHYNLLQKQN